MKAAVLALFLGGCASWAEVPKAMDPVTQNALPVTGEALERLSAAFYAICGTEQPRSEGCDKAKESLNMAIREYNKINDNFLDNY